MPLQMRGQVSGVYIKAERGGPMQTLPRVRAIAGRGLEGDRYATVEGGKPDAQVTLIEEEAIRAIKTEKGISVGPEESRRNITTRGVALNHLVGREFTVGAARLRGIRLCEPCGYLEKLTGKPVREALVHRGGLRAEVVSGGDIAVGDPIEPVRAVLPDRPIIGG